MVTLMVRGRAAGVIDMADHLGELVDPRVVWLFESVGSTDSMAKRSRR